MRTFHINGDEFNLPRSWNELRPDQLIRIGELSLNNISANEFKLKLFLKITGLMVERKKDIVIDDEPCFYLIHGKTHEYLVSCMDIVTICKQLDWMLAEVENTENEITYVIDSKLTKQLIPEIKADNGYWYGPADGLSNLTLKEYIHAETIFYEYQSKHKINYVNQLIATLYRPGSFKERVQLDDTTIRERADQLQSLHPAIKNAIVIWYKGCRWFIAERFPEVFSGEGSKGSDRNDIFMGFMKLVNALTNNDVTKTEAVRNSYLYEVMVSLNEQARQYKEMKKKYNTAKY